jgi:hypothetical protein
VCVIIPIFLSPEGVVRIPATESSTSIETGHSTSKYQGFPADQPDSFRLGRIQPVQ